MTRTWPTAARATAATITVSGLAGGETGFARSQYAVSSAGAVCSAVPLRTANLGSTFEMRSVPASEQATDEYHVAYLTINTGNNTKLVQEAFSTLADRTVAVPADMPAPTLTDVTGGANYLRLQADLTVPAEYDTWVLFDYFTSNTNVAVFATSGVMSGSVSLIMPDFTGVAGWSDEFAMSPSATGVEYGVAAQGQTGEVPLCTDGGRSVFGGISGTYN